MTYLWVKIRTDQPQDLLCQAEKAFLKPLKEFYLPEERLLYLVYPSEDLEQTLLLLQRCLSGADIEETELSPDLSPGPRRFRIGPLIFFSPLKPVPPSPEEPPWADSPEIYLRTSFSFGSGSHPTTRLCLELLIDLWERETFAKILDLGCGSGILALSAVKLGARRVLAADIDPRACREAQHNVEMNGFTDRVLVVQGSLSAVRPESFDLVLANLTIGTILALAPEIPRVLRPGGVAVLSGFAEGQKREVFRNLPEAEILGEKTKEGWLALALRF